MVEEVRTGFQDSLLSKFVACNDSAALDLTTAFDLEVLEVDPKAIMLRHLAKKHALTILELEDLHQRFREVDLSSSGSLVEPTFIALVLSLHGAVDRADIPMTRLHFFWQQADSDNS